MTQYTWIAAFKAISTWLEGYEHRQPELIAILKDIGIDKGLDDEDAHGNTVPLIEIDPFSFFSLFMKYGIEQRTKYFAELLRITKLPVSAPTDFDGVPGTQALKVWLFPYAKERNPEMISTLWAVYFCARDKTLDEELFSKALAIPNTGFAKLTECLFYAFPDEFLPIDGQTKPWLKKLNIILPDPSWEAYQQCLVTVKNQFTEPFAELSYRAWAENEAARFSAQAAIEYLQKRFPDTYSGTIHVSAFRCISGRELAFDPSLKPEKKRKIQVFISKSPDEPNIYKKITEYPVSKGRNNHLRQHAPSLAAGNRVWSVTINSEDKLQRLCDWYSGEKQTGKEPVIKMENGESMGKQPLNQIFYGPPGTGKTFATTAIAVKITDPAWYDEHLNEPDLKERRIELKARYDELISQKRIVFTTFHQSFSYEDFIEGIRAVTAKDTKALTYPIVPGVFKALVEDAKNSTGSGQQIGLSITPKIWKISIDKRGPSTIRDHCFENGEARIGWNKTGDMSLPAEEIGEREQSYWDGLSVTNQNTVSSFVAEMKPGDVLLCLKDKSTIQAIGIIASDYHFDEIAAEPDQHMFAHVRNVNWLFTGLDLNILAINDNKHLVQKTVYQLDRINWDSVLTLLNAHGYELDVESGEKPNYVLIIDEINRGNIARIFGEMITLLEPSKRSGAQDARNVVLPYSKESFTVPPNVYVIGTMNTADKSLSQLDLALRRRFNFIEIPPLPKLLVGIRVHGVDIQEVLTCINQRIEVLLDRDHLIGHSYFFGLLELGIPSEQEKELARVFSQNILPLLQEYFFDDWERIGWVLNDSAKTIGDRFVQQMVGRAVNELFSSNIAEQLTDRRYSINEKAFSNPLAYQGIIRTSNGTTVDA